LMAASAGVLSRQACSEASTSAGIGRTCSSTTAQCQWRDV
jgi:hypothetical protein